MSIESEYQDALSEKMTMEAFDRVRDPQSKEMCRYVNERLIACSHSKSKHVERVEWNGTEYITLYGYCVSCKGNQTGAAHIFDPVGRVVIREEFEEMYGEG